MFFFEEYSLNKSCSWTHTDLHRDPKDIISALNEFKKHYDPLLAIKGKRQNRNVLNAFFTLGDVSLLHLKIKFKIK